MRIVMSGILVLLLCSFGINAQNQFYNILDFGAMPDGKTLSTNAIQKTINEAFEKGGGTVYFPPGEFLSGSIELKSKVSIRFESGSKLIGSTDLSHYSGENKSFITGTDLSDISISGKGVIDGNGPAFWDENFKALERPEPWILLENVENLSFEGLKLINSPSHVIRLENSKDATFHDLTIINDFRGPNTDGIDIVDSEYVRISDSFISTGDDAICLKTQRKPVENVVVTNCILESDDAAIKFGTGSKKAVRFCNFSNITIRKTRYGISLFMLDGGIYEYNSFSNILIEGGSRHEHEYPIFIDIDKKTPKRSYGIVRYNTFSNIQIVSGGKLLISGHEQSPIERLSFKNVQFYLTDEQDFSKAKKPRGNKNYPKLETSIDLSRETATMVFGFMDQLEMDNVRVINKNENSKRKEMSMTQVESVSRINSD
ncbi:MAG: glycosyl hydrolase family 28 protein [Bacteroidota bacterium]